MTRGQEKITRSHRERLAYIYVRQSSSTQVRHNLESQQRQYELQAWVEASGWPAENIRVMDEDLGCSADGTRGREGFARLRAQVCEGNVGLIMSLEVSRLARNNREWYHLLDLCAVCGTLVAEPAGIYDPREYDDRLHLGLKGILCEAELHLLKSRLVAGARHKAERGELVMKLPVGLVTDDTGQVVLDPDQQVQHVLRSIFEKFRELGSVRQVYRWMRSNDVKLPRRLGSGLFSEVMWQTPTYAALQDIFQNPRYAGTYVFGRSEACMRVAAGEPRRSRRALPIEQWKVVLPDVHAGYISWAEFVRNREHIRQNYVGGESSRGAPGRGAALLQGLTRCGRCGARMLVHYRALSRQDGTTRSEVVYTCGRGTAQFLTKRCQGVGARLADQVVAEAFLEALKPARLAVTLEDLDRLDESAHAAERQWQMRLERARYEAERARRQYDHVEPEDRLVAGELERRWEARLREAKQAEDDYTRWQQQRAGAWTDGQRQELRELVQDVAFLWQARTTTHADRKELLRLLIEDVWLLLDRELRVLDVRILWRGGSQTAHRREWWINGRGVRQEVVAAIAGWAEQGVLDREIASRLNEAGHRRFDGGLFDPHHVTMIRLKHGIAQGEPPREPDVYNLKETAQLLGVSPEAVRTWIRAGLLAAAPADGYRPRQVRLTEADRTRLTGGWERQSEWTVPETTRYLGIPWWQVYKLIERGTLPARATTVGRRTRLLVRAEAAQAYKAAVVDCPETKPLRLVISIT